MDKNEYEAIIWHIRSNLNGIAGRDDFIPFITDQTMGYIPIALLDAFINSSEFDYDGSSIRFAPHINGFQAKTEAMINVCNLMLVAGLIKQKPSNYKDESITVGSRGRVTDPEFVIDRAYAKYFGFQGTGNSLQLIVDTETGPRLLLQIRGKNVIGGGTLDFAAGGAVKHGIHKDFHAAIREQADHEIGLDSLGSLDMTSLKQTGTLYLQRVNRMTLPNGKEISTFEKLHIPLYAMRISKKEAEEIIAQSRSSEDEAAGFILATPEEIIRFCAKTDAKKEDNSYRIAPVMVQSFMASLITTGLMPPSDFSALIEEELFGAAACRRISFAAVRAP